ncbi:MAG: hypothetical protein PHQ23_09600, partial [Candidatus Wallbacteria bacterium]|nr:hypothetical protein [Candidatus Wallbacteria bacterium]
RMYHRQYTCNTGGEYYINTSEVEIAPNGAIIKVEIICTRHGTVSKTFNDENIIQREDPDFYKEKLHNRLWDPDCLHFKLMTLYIVLIPVLALVLLIRMIRSTDKHSGRV